MAEEKQTAAGPSITRAGVPGEPPAWTPGVRFSADPQTLSGRVASLTDAESQQILQFLAGLSPDDVDVAISTIKALQREPR
jgi:hypothetical protein